MSKAISRRDFLKVSGAVGAAGLLAACGGSGNAGSTARFCGGGPGHRGSPRHFHRCFFRRSFRGRSVF